MAACDAIRPCWRCGKLMKFQNGDVVTMEVHKGHLLPIHEMCKETDQKDPIFGYIFERETDGESDERNDDGS